MIWLLVLATFTCTIQGQDQPKIFSDTKYISGFPNQFSLYVTTNYGANFMFHWEHNGDRIDSNYSLAFNGETTTYLRPDRQDVSDDLTNLAYQGTYQFFMETPDGTIAGHKLKVEFTYLGEFSERKPSDIRKVVVGQAALIKCPKHTPGNNFVYKWGKISPFSGIRFINAGNNYIVLDNGSLFFSHLKKKDMGYINDFHITCLMEANVGKNNRFSSSHVVKLSNISQNWTKFGPDIVTKLPIKVFTVGENIIFKCAATGNPVPTYSWKIIDSEGNEKPIVDGENNIVFADGDSRILQIKSTKKSHAGKYICTATIGENSDSVEGELTYQEKPSWTSDDIKSVKPSVYSSHSWQCVATGSPKPNYNWYKNGKQIINSSNFQIDEGKITFPKLEKGNSGMYQCVAANDFGNIYRTAHLHVQAMKPTFKENRAMTTLFLNNPGTINCSAKAAPVAKNTWMMNGTVINTNIPRYELVNNQDLIIKKVNKSDIGNYTCIAKNLYGKDSKTIQIEVIGEIKFVQAPVDINITQTENIRLSCEVKREQNIVVRYKWRFNNKELNTDAKVIWSLGSHTLLILQAEVKHSGVYECIAFIDTPSYSEMKRSATVIVRGPPEEINTLKVEGGCDDLQAKLTWSTVHKLFDPIKYFIIEWRTSYESDKWYNYASRVPSHRREKVVKDLSPYALYSFRVLAVNAIGTSDNIYNTDFIDCKTPARATIKCPTLTGHPGKKDELTIRWKRMDLIDQNGPKFHYQLEYQKRGGSIWRNKTLNTVTGKFDIPNAGFYELWDFRIRGVNEAGSGSVCSGKSYSGQNAPDKMPFNFRAVLTGATYVDVEWDPIVLDQGSVDGYKIKYWKKPDLPTNLRRRSDDPFSCDKNDVCIKDIVGGLTRSIRVQRLAPLRTYVMSISGYNSGGAGPYNSLQVVIKEGLPGIPDAVVVIAYGTFVVLMWKEPKRANGVIKGYKVHISNNNYQKESVLDGANKKRYVFSGLKPQELYKVFVQAKTEAGYGASKILKVATLKPALPGQPKPPLVERTGKDGVNVTYIEGKKGGFPQTFSVVYREKGLGEDGFNQTAPQLLNGMEKQTVEISGLDTSIEYEFATFAQNYYGRSTWSEYNSTFPGAGVTTYICQLCSCHADSFTEKTIDCRSKRLVEMPHFRTRYTDGTIRSYTVKYNQITTVSKESLQQLPNLKYLDLSINKISIIPVDVFKNNPNIQVLDLSYNRISSIPEDVFKNNPNIQELHLTYNKISLIPVDVFKNNLNIEILHLNYNKITLIPVDVFKNNPNIEILFLDHNKISVIPVDVFKNNPNIQFLGLSYNNISLIPVDAFKYLPNIQSLYLDRNKLSTIPVNVFKNNPNIQNLFLDHNKISMIPVDVFKNNPNIRHLGLSYNNISLIPVDVFKYLPAIGSLMTSGLTDCCNAYRITSGGIWNCNYNHPPYKKCGVKLIAGNQSSSKRTSMGIVEVYDDGKWKIICDKNWTMGDADVICKDIGFIGAIEPSLLPFDVQENKTALNYDYMCTGNEDYLIKCPRSMTRSSSCSHAANVRCKDEGNELCKICKCTSSYVDCGRRKLEYMPWTNSKFGGNITRFNISNNKLKNVSGDLLQSFSNLQYMDLSNNRLEELPKTVFTSSTQLKQLNLCKNNFKSLDTKFLENLTNLEKLDISANSALKIQSWTFLLKMKNLKELKASTSSQCCFVRHERPDVKCIAPKDYIISKCDSVTKSKKAQPMVWIIIVVIAAGGCITLVIKNNM